ncbi:Calmodulin-binding domain [Thalictrum thalictroides]|uniref:Calmodulin-binding domain n=1 Tax=Thalictrum thalictroides TaxID=46969 RepID=A0A7J6WSJ2_THATH|nr:Calmodulin-binding domain [Thalictrum thalictroides]
MVQRKAPDKLGIQADSKNYVKPEKRSTTQKLSTSQNQENRNKGGSELKKIMKKSRSIKRSDCDITRSNSMKRGAKSRPAKSPAPGSNKMVAPVTPQKPTPLKIPETSPNYMKSTSSSIARKERSQVSPQSSKTSCDSNSPGRKDTIFPKLSSASGHKPGKTLTKTSSLRPVRTLTKTSSNKASRTSMKKNSGVALYTDQTVRKATCSSTLKDSKFPTYVMLHSGGTESEGTSVVKVCPYTYCSLNGHHHAQLPPLKTFLSARRRLLKTQKSMRLKSLSSMSRKLSGKPNKDIHQGQMVFNKDPEISENNSAGSAIAPLIKGEPLDFFVEIYAQQQEEGNKSVGRNIDDGNEVKKDLSVDLGVLKSSSYLPKDGVETEDNDGERYEDLPDASSHSATSFEDDIDLFMEDMDISMFSFKDVQKEKSDDGVGSPYFIGVETNLAYRSSRVESAESESDGSTSEATSMDWEEGEVVDTHLDDKADCSKITSDEHDPIMCLHGFTYTLLEDELTFNSDEIVINCYEDVPVNEELEIVHKEDNQYIEKEFDGVDQALEIELSGNISSDDLNIFSSQDLHNPLPYSEDAIEKSITIFNEKDDNFICDVSSDAAIYPLEEHTHNLLDDEKPTGSNVEHMTKSEQQEDNFSEHDINHSTLPEDPDADAEVALCLQESEDKECKVEVEISESADLETDMVIATGKDFNLNNLRVDANVGDDARKVAANEDQLVGLEQKIYTLLDEHICSEGNILKSVEGCSILGDKMEEDGTRAEKITIANAGSGAKEETHTNGINYNKPVRCKRPTEDYEEPREFNPRGPRFLPLEPEEDPETVDLRHQMMDERKNSEEWMVDYALRQAVNKLAPARKRKVALLVEAFETVIPLPRYEIHLPHTPTSFTHTRFMQTCS